MGYIARPGIVKIDPIVTNLQPDQFNNDEPIQSYPFGPSTMRVTTATGFPEIAGDVITSRTSEDTGNQIFVGAKVYIRTFGLSGWSSWREIGEGSSGAVEWDNILNKPAQFPPAAHTHTISEIDGLQTALDEKESVADAEAHKEAKASLTQYGHIQHGVIAATILRTGWSSSAPYTNDVVVPGILVTDTPIIDVVATSSTIQDAWGKIFRAVTDTDLITFYATEVPAVDIPIQIKVVR